MSVQILRNSYEVVGHTYREFPGGEPHVTVPNISTAYGTIQLNARIRSWQDLGELLAVTNAIRQQGHKGISLFLPYFPGARQDRPFPGGAFTLKLYADIINAQGYERVTIVDPHSYVTPALINNVKVRDVSYLQAEFAVHRGPFVALIAPDAGATNRVEALAKLFHDEYKFKEVKVITASKHRDAASGRITGYYLPTLTEVGRYIVIDDICDGGTTFELLATAFHSNELNLGSWAGVNVKPSLDLWVTHGIFSNSALDRLSKQYEVIGTTDSFFRPSEEEWQRYKHKLQIHELRP